MRGRPAIVVVLLIVVLILALGGVARAQTISGIIAGTVADEQGKPLPSVGIRAINPQSGRIYPASTSSQGYYRILEVPPGDYNVEAVSPGYRRESHTAVHVSVNRTTIEDFSLQVQSSEQPRQLPSAAPMTNIDSPTLSTAFPERQIRELPILTRDVNTLGLLAPGTVSVRSFSFASTLVPFAVNGSRGRDNNFIIDSVDNNEPLFGGAASQFTNTEIFSEYAILTSQLKAEFGRNSGATINAITKSGSNDVHGTAFWYGQDDPLNALTAVERAALLTSPARFYENTIGAALGGAIKKEKTFYFISYQWDRARDNLSDVFPVVSTLPTGTGGPNPGGIAALQGISFANPQPINALLGLRTLQVVPNQTAPCFKSPAPAGFSTTNPCLVNPNGNVTVNGTPIQFNAYRVLKGNLFDVRDHQFSGRLDHRINSVNDIYARYLFDDLAAPRFPVANAGEAAFSDSGLYPDWRLLNRQRTQSLLLNHRYYRVSSLNELRFSYSRVSQRVGSFDLPGNVRENQAAATINDLFDTPNNVVNGGLGPFGNAFPAAGKLIALGLDNRPSKITSNTYQIQDNFSVTKGPHRIKFGGNVVRIESNIRSTSSDLGDYIYESKFGFMAASPTPGLQGFLTEPVTGGINASGFPATNAIVTSQRFTNVITDSTGNIIGQGRDAVMLREYDEFMFMQDDWRIRKNLTISAGLRYEIFGQPINSIRKFNPAGPHVEKDLKDFGPRLGFAWSPRKDLVFRGGYAIQYNPTVLNVPLLIWQSGPISPVFTTDAFGFRNFPGINAVAQPSGVWPNRPYSLADVNVGVAGCSYFLSPSFFAPPLPTLGDRTTQGTIPLLNCSDQETVDPHLKNPYGQNFSLGVQYQLAPNWLVEVGYVGSKGTRLFQRIERNPFTGWNLTCVQMLQNLVPQQCRNPRQPLPAVDNHGDITETTNGASSIYHGLQASLTKRVSHIPRFGDVTLNTAYSWSHMIDNASEIFGPGFRFFQLARTTSTNNSQSAAQLLLNPLASAPVESITPFAQVFNQTTGAERGNSSFDRRHRFAASFLWEPFPTGGIWLRGWQLNGIVSVQSGQPFTPLNASPQSACADANGDGLVGNDRPDIGNPRAPVGSVALVNVAANPGCLPTLSFRNGNQLTGYVGLDGVTPVTDATTVRFVQRTLQASATAGGSAPRNILLGPGLVNLDLAIYKNVKVRELFTLQFRWEVYDVFNHPNFGNAIGNAFATDAQAAPAYAFSSIKTAAAITGVIPENALDALSLTKLNAAGGAVRTFLSRDTLNTSNRRMQFGIRLIF